MIFKLSRSILSLCLCVVFIGTSSLSAFASTSYSETTSELSINAIIEEYQDEMAELGLSVSLDPRRRTVASQEELEEFRELIEWAIDNNRRTIEMYEENGLKWEDVEWLPCIAPTDASSNVGAVAPRGGADVVRINAQFNPVPITVTAGGFSASSRAYLLADLLYTDATGVITFRNILNAWTDYVSGNTGFESTSYSRSLIDAMRTVLITYKGNLVANKSNGFIVSGVTHSVYFYAKEGWK